MSVRAIAAGSAALLALAAAACAPALKPPPVSAAEIERSAAPATAPAEPATATAIERARAAWQRRPDREAVRTAERAFLEAAEGDPAAAEPLIGAARAKAWLAEHEPDAAAREALATSMVRTAQLCTVRVPGDPACDYWLGIALGLQAREKPSTAEAGIKEMVAALRRADRADALMDQAGPARVLALVYLRAPGWPVGPGDVETGLSEARRAVAARPDHPPNRLALGEALEKNGDREAARREYALARDAARAAAESGAPRRRGVAP